MAVLVAHPASKPSAPLWPYLALTSPSALPAFPAGTLGLSSSARPRASLSFPDVWSISPSPLQAGSHRISWGGASPRHKFTEVQLSPGIVLSTLTPLVTLPHSSSASAAAPFCFWPPPSRGGGGCAPPTQGQGLSFAFSESWFHRQPLVCIVCSPCRPHSALHLSPPVTGSAVGPTVLQQLSPKPSTTKPSGHCQPLIPKNCALTCPSSLTALQAPTSVLPHWLPQESPSGPH